MNAKELDGLSRVLAGVLRHFPERFGLKADSSGFVDLGALIYAIRKRRTQYHWLRKHHIRALVATDPKGRYEISKDKIRATYGHTFEVTDLNLPTDNIPDTLYYPATEEEVEILLETGLKPVDRKLVHLSKTIETAEIAGKHRIENPIILEIDAKRVVEDGIPIYRAGTTVFTTDWIPAKYISIITVSKSKSYPEISNPTKSRTNHL
jgi:putative RNA 2'-phosphotransferase